MTVSWFTTAAAARRILPCEAPDPLQQDEARHLAISAFGWALQQMLHGALPNRVTPCSSSTGPHLVAVHFSSCSFS